MVPSCHQSPTATVQLYIIFIKIFQLNISGPGWTRSPADLSALSDPFIAHPLDTQDGGAGSVQRLIRWYSLHVQVVPEHGRPRPRPGGHPQVREGCEAANQTGEVEHHGGDPEHASQLSLGGGR